MFSKIAIIICTPDPAAMNVKKQLLSMYSWKKEGNFEGYPIQVLESGSDVRMYTTDTSCIHCEQLDDQIDADLFLFATKHFSKSGIPSLSVHTQGNWGKAEYGGVDKELAIGSGKMLGNAFLKLKEICERDSLEIDVIQEVTHHGPSLKKPSMFIEIGSSEKEWVDPVWGKVNAEVVHHLVTSYLEEFSYAIGVGGLHHCPRFTKVFLSEKIAFVHVCPKYALESLNLEMLGQAVERSVEKVKFVYLDWKGLGGEKQRLKLICEKICEEKGLELRRC